MFWSDLSPSNHPSPLGLDLWPVDMDLSWWARATRQTKWLSWDLSRWSWGTAGSLHSAPLSLARMKRRYSGMSTLTGFHLAPATVPNSRPKRALAPEPLGQGPASSVSKAMSPSFLLTSCCTSGSCDCSRSAN